jgi:hypothetical protein
MRLIVQRATAFESEHGWRPAASVSQHYYAAIAPVNTRARGLAACANETAAWVGSGRAVRAKCSRRRPSSRYELAAAPLARELRLFDN